jgi:hypothetical protein
MSYNCIHLSSNHVVSFFLWLNKIPLCVCVSHFLSFFFLKIDEKLYLESREVSTLIEICSVCPGAVHSMVGGREKLGNTSNKRVGALKQAHLWVKVGSLWSLALELTCSYNFFFILLFVCAYKAWVISTP